MSQLGTVSRSIRRVHVSDLALAAMLVGRAAAAQVSISSLCISPSTITLLEGQSQAITATATYTDNSTRNVTAQVSWSSTNLLVVSITGAAAQATFAGNASITALLDGLTASAPVQVDDDPTLPPDPSLIAPPLDRTVTTNMCVATLFLYSGSPLIQTGVAQGTIDCRRVAVLRGRVLKRDGSPLSGVRIRIHDHPEFGGTKSRLDGAFDIAVNGGGPLTVEYTKGSYLSASRLVEAAWQDYSWLPDVTLIPYDASVTTIDLSSPPGIQIARGSEVSDPDGSRQATLLFAPGTQATLAFSDGSSRPLSLLHVRATEYTVAPTGLSAMPAQLPPQSGYTYCVELSVDEAVAAGAGTVRFDRSVVSYLENFIGFPVGSGVPAGFYDRQLAQWIPLADGRVIKILSVTAGLADVDIDGDGVADDDAALSSLGFYASERAALASLYQPGQTLWRVQLEHFSPCDWNWQFRVPPDATYPFNGAPKGSHGSLDKSCHQGGSIIECQNQTLGQATGLTGSPFKLFYWSDRVLGRQTNREMLIPVSGPDVPASLIRIDLEISIAGQHFKRIFPPAANQDYLFTWNGKDAYGRTLQGEQSVFIRTGYVYRPGYYPVSPNLLSASFLRLIDEVERVILPLGQVAGRSEEYIVWSTRASAIGDRLGGWDATALGFGAFSVDAHQVFDPNGRILLGGDGRRRTAAQTFPIIPRAAGNGQYGQSGDGGPARNAGLGTVGDLAVAPDNSLLIADSDRVRRIAPNGIISTLAGGGSMPPQNGLHATDVAFSYIRCLALGPDGSLYVGDRNLNRVFRIDANGILRIVAGNGDVPDCGTHPALAPAAPSVCNRDGGPATQVAVKPDRLAIGPDGSVYILDEASFALRRVLPDGFLTSVVGRGFADEGPAPLTAIAGASALAVDRDGNLLIGGGGRLRRIGPDGIVHTVAGSFTEAGFSGDGGPAVSARFNGIVDVKAGRDGSIYVADVNNRRVRRIDPSGLVTTLAGIGAEGIAGQDGPAARMQFTAISAVAAAPNGDVFVVDAENFLVYRVTPPFAGYGGASFLIPDESGQVLFAFDPFGRHLSTLSAATSQILLTFGYDPAGHLTSVTDGDSNVTQFERNGSGEFSGVLAPGGQHTTVTPDGNGYLGSVSNPAGETTTFSYTADGLMQTLTDPRGGQHQFSHDAAGRLILDQDPAGGSKALARYAAQNGYQVTLTTALNRVFTYLVENLSAGDERRTDTNASGLTVQSTRTMAGIRRFVNPDGSTAVLIEAPDPRWGMQVPYANGSKLTTPGGRLVNITSSRSATLADPTTPLSLVSETSTTTINGRSYSAVFDASSKTSTLTSPSGRILLRTIDAQGRVVQTKFGSLLPVDYGYDAQGRLSSISQGIGPETRMVGIGYDTLYRPQAMTDPLGQSTTFGYDTADRVKTGFLPLGRDIGFDYDLNGNVTSLTPPGKPAHLFDYTSVDLPLTYTAPPAGGQPNITTFGFNVDKAPTYLSMPGSESVGATYDAGGRLSLLTTPQATIGYTYDAATGSVTTITESTGETLSFAYDAFLPTSATLGGPVSGEVDLSWNNDLQLVSELVNAGPAVTFGYDPDGLVSQAGAVTVSHDTQTGFVTGTTLGVVTDAVGYSNFGELASYAAKYALTPLFSQTFTRDKLGRITQKVETIQGQTSTYDDDYDDAGRLTDVTRDGTLLSHYDYDLNGNREARSGQFNFTATYDAQDRLTQYGETTYTYTPSGSLLTKSQGTSTVGYDYDALGNLRHVTLASGIGIDYIIDGLNRRVGKKVNGMLVEGLLYHSHLKPVAELDGMGNVVSRFVYGSRWIVPDYMIRGGATYRIVSDYLGCPRLVVNVADGTVAQRMDFDDFGNVINDTNPGFQPFGFAGGLYDYQTGLVRFGARDYEAETGRWTARDPLDFEGGDTNLYTYCANDPVDYRDPYGLFDWVDDVLTPFSNFSAGLGDSLTFGLTSEARDITGANSVVDKCSGWFTLGEIGGIALSTAIGAGAGLEAAGAKAAGNEFSHWIPNRALGRTGFDFIQNSFGRSPLNGNYVSVVDHALNDPFRYRMMPRSWKDSNELNSALARQWNRFPRILGGAGAGAAYGGAGGAAATGCGCS